MPRVTFDLTVDYEEEEKQVVHDINVQLTPNGPKPSTKKDVTRRRRVTRRRFTGRYVKRHGGFASAAYAKRYPGRVRKVYRKVIGYRTVTETVETVERWTDEDAFKAFWAAHKIVQRGGKLETEFTDWTVAAIDWRKGGRLYEYVTANATEVIGAMGGILEDDATTIRVGLIER